MIILGVDPGIATVGFGVIQAERNIYKLLQYGVISTAAGQRLSARLLQIALDFEQLIDLFHPDAVAVEELFFNNLVGIDKFTTILFTTSLSQHNLV